ncbi:hypothetical protein EIP86_010721 [Pleurotus ostreatoroseus]|nr:hypothetical protein EIP86_010721 [Pleurotus ostreatoroseus]
MKRRRQFSELLASNSNLTFNRYIRLMCLAGIELLCTVPIASYLLARELRSPIYQWRGLGDLHWGFSAVHQTSSIMWLMDPGNVTLLTMEQWLYVTCGLIFFLFFGLAEEARTHYRQAFTTVAKKLGYSTGPSATSGFSSGLPPSKGQGSKLGISITIPSFIQRSVHRRDSIGSFSDKLSTSISVGDTGALDDFKEKPYSPTSTGGSSSMYLPTTPVAHDIPELPMMPDTHAHSALVPPEIEVTRPALVADIESAMHTHRHSPDVPSPIYPSDMIV